MHDLGECLAHWLGGDANQADERRALVVGDGFSASGNSSCIFAAA